MEKLREPSLGVFLFGINESNHNGSEKLQWLNVGIRMRKITGEVFCMAALRNPASELTLKIINRLAWKQIHFKFVSRTVCGKRSVFA